MLVLLDMDGVLVDFTRASLAFHGKHIPPREVQWNFPLQCGFDLEPHKFWDPLGFDFWQGLPHTHEGPTLLAGLEAMVGQENICLLTSPIKTRGCADGKIAWIERELPAYARQYFLGTAKDFAAGWAGKVLVDDHDKNVDAFAKPRKGPGGRTLLIPRSWNRRHNEIDDHGRFDVAAVLTEFKMLLQEAL